MVCSTSVPLFQSAHQRTEITYKCRNHPLESLTELYTDLMRGVDLTPRDEVVALLLLAAHQRNMRRRHIKRKLAGKNCCKGPPDFCHRHNVHLPKSKQEWPNAEQQQQQQQSRQERLLLKHHQNGVLSADNNQDGEANGERKDLSSSSEEQPSQKQWDLSNTNSIKSCGDESESTSSFISREQVSVPSGHLARAMHLPQPSAGQQQEIAPGNDQPNGPMHQAGSWHSQHNNAYSQQQQQPQMFQQPAQLKASDAMRPQQYGTAQHDVGPHGSKPGKPINARPKLEQMQQPTGVDVEQGWGASDDTEMSDVDKDAQDGDASVFEEGRGCGFPSVITPSSMAAELAPNLTQQEAADLYLGQLVAPSHVRMSS